ncbi:LysM peptidoglycan-binding domain-containing protein [Halobacillus litoralis]|uniref:LysM peptidoglycan-binding and 3D domain-containing protein n=1 Tax=Halobacillus litoralis TaxID=45668 RepID=UPI001CFD4454|nr:3D domain-containing protein [Halobacillus litoralis]WLR49428.1 LysM peptidoglycan-binding domain-containing protein [Halobacillus litoralis]
MKKTIVSLAAVASVSAVTATAVSADEIKVEKGDTLWGIAQNNGVSVNDIKEENGLNSNLIFPNQVLSINEGQNGNAQSQTSSSVHTVQSGDTLYSIGQANNVSVQELKAWNNLNSNLIYPGEKLTLDGAAVAEQSTSEKSSSNETAEAEQTSSQPAEDGVVKTLNMEATAYTAFCEGCSGITSTGIDLRANPDQKVIAVDPNVIPLGSEVYVEGYGKAIAGDIGGAIQGNRIDVFMADRSDALDFGRKSVEVKVYE